MKKFAVVLGLILSQSAFAGAYDRPCYQRYREASELLIDAAREFNNSNYNSWQFVGRFSLIETRIGSVRAVCTFVSETREEKECGLLYKAQYKKLRNAVDVLDILSGYQTKVKIGLGELALEAVDVKCALKGLE